MESECPRLTGNEQGPPFFNRDETVCLPEKEQVPSEFETGLHAGGHTEDNLFKKRTSKQGAEELRSFRKKNQYRCEWNRQAIIEMTRPEVGDLVYVRAKSTSSGNLSTLRNDSNSTFVGGDGTEKVGRDICCTSHWCGREPRNSARVRHTNMALTKALCTEDEPLLR